MKGGQSPSLELVSREFRKQRLAPWAAGRGPDSSFAAMVFWCCDTVRLREHKQAGRWPMKGGQSPSLELQCEAPKIAKLVYNSKNYGLWYL